MMVGGEIMTKMRNGKKRLCVYVCVKGGQSKGKTENGTVLGRKRKMTKYI